MAKGTLVLDAAKANDYVVTNHYIMQYLDNLLTLGYTSTLTKWFGTSGKVSVVLVVSLTFIYTSEPRK